MNIELRRAYDALTKAKQALNEFGTGASGVDYRSYATRLGPAILTSGLGQALATEFAAGYEPGMPESNPHRRLFDNVTSWLIGDDGPYTGTEGGDSAIFDEIMDSDQRLYRMAQAEALAWLEWHVKFCRAFFPRRSGE